MKPRILLLLIVPLVSISQKAFCQKPLNKFVVHYACMPPAHEMDSAERAVLGTWLNNFSAQHHIPVNKIKIEIDHIPSSDNKQELVKARLAVQDMSRFFSSKGIKKTKITYEKFNKLNSPAEVCKDIELAICLSE